MRCTCASTTGVPSSVCNWNAPVCLPAQLHYPLPTAGFSVVASGDPLKPQGFNPVAKRSTIYPGDPLTVTCVFDSSDKDAPVSAGPTHDHEMCNMYLMVGGGLRGGQGSKHRGVRRVQRLQAALAWQRAATTPPLHAQLSCTHAAVPRCQVYSALPHIEMCNDGEGMVSEAQPGSLPRGALVAPDPFPGWQPPRPSDKVVSAGAEVRRSCVWCCLSCLLTWHCITEIGRLRAETSLFGKVDLPGAVLPSHHAVSPPTQGILGDITSVALGPDGTLWALHRGGAVWDGNTFDPAANKMRNPTAIPVAVVLQMEADTGAPERVVG